MRCNVTAEFQLNTTNSKGVAKATVPSAEPTLKQSVEFNIAEAGLNTRGSVGCFCLFRGRGHIGSRFLNWRLISGNWGRDSHGRVNQLHGGNAGAKFLHLLEHCIELFLLFCQGLRLRLQISLQLLDSSFLLLNLAT